ncbi:MAG: hypothetical protein IKB20_05225 [Clostridia bacterium]|nr:hypothetical protein [Clostridia bacterium]
MFLKDITNKPVFANGCLQGVCRGVGISLKTYAVKYLLCASTPTQSATDFAVGVSAIESVQNEIRLSRLRVVYPKSCAKIFIGAPVYSFEGGYLGKVADLQIRDFVATSLVTDQGERFSVASLYACSDAVILKKEQPYPLGQRIPAPMLSLVECKKEAVVTKPVLRAAIRQKALINLTLSLPPFNAEL